LLGCEDPNRAYAWRPAVERSLSVHGQLGEVDPRRGLSERRREGPLRRVQRGQPSCGQSESFRARAAAEAWLSERRSALEELGRAAYWFTASTSFANPAVTLARGFTATFSGIEPSGVAAFMLAQLAGAALALAADRATG
jgi:hypothetical protein